MQGFKLYAFLNVVSFAEAHVSEIISELAYVAYNKAYPLSFLCTTPL